ncbi:MAG: hypothetical protein Q8O89_06530, partial [Nanoarchaeota archaeon]|nr:hypothetical protein [Nanoarchaeota archaeon]
DASCLTCYNVSIHESIISGLGMKVVSQTKLDVNDVVAKELISKYNITKVPTIIISKDASDYTVMADVWPSVGTYESDGALVFRDVTMMGTYRDLTTNSIVNVMVEE